MIRVFRTRIGERASGTEGAGATRHGNGCGNIVESFGREADDDYLIVWSSEQGAWK